MMKNKNKIQKSSLAKRNWQKFLKNRMAVVGLIGLAIIVGACLVAPLLTPYDPTFIDPPNRELAPVRSIS